MLGQRANLKKSCRSTAAGIHKFIVAAGLCVNASFVMGQVAEPSGSAVTNLDQIAGEITKEASDQSQQFGDQDYSQVTDKLLTACEGLSWQVVDQIYGLDQSQLRSVSRQVIGHKLIGRCARLTKLSKAQLDLDHIDKQGYDGIDTHCESFMRRRNIVDSCKAQAGPTSFCRKINASKINEDCKYDEYISKLQIKMSEIDKAGDEAAATSDADQKAMAVARMQETLGSMQDLQAQHKLNKEEYEKQREEWQKQATPE